MSTPDGESLRDSLVQICSCMVAAPSSSGDVARFFVDGAQWRGRLLYDGEWDEEYRLCLDGDLDQSSTASGVHCAFGGEEQVEVKIWTGDGPSRARIHDGESMLCGEIGEGGSIRGVAYSVNEKGKKCEEGEFELNLC